MLSIASKAISSVHNFLSPTKKMSTPQGMEMYATRLDSFGTTTKKRASNTKGSKANKWPHKSPAGAQMARAGFYYSPTATSPDNVTCVSCHKSMDEWQPEDDPIKEHLAYSPECGIAIHANLEQELEAGNREVEDPMSEKMIEARKATFGDMWPHERKRAWTCKTQKLVEAGWYYCPTPESDDFVRCAYCSLSLDGWEPKDKPLDEHQKRSAECLFFILASEQQPKAKAAKGKKGRASKASRMSTQPNMTTATQDVSMVDTEPELGDASIMTTATDITVASTATTTKGKKGAKTKKGANKSKAAKAEEVPPLEPEIEDQEVKVIEEVKAASKGKKRTSEAMSIDAVDGIEPPPKRRGTRVRSSTVRPEPTPSQEIEDTPMADVEDLQPATGSKKGAKGKKRASSTTRKASSASTASKAPLRALGPSDNEIEAELEAELVRPLSDEEQEAPKKATRGTKAKGSQKKAASTAPTRGRKAKSTLEDGNSTQDLEGQMELDASTNFKASTNSAASHTAQTALVDTEEDHTMEENPVPIVNPKGRQAKRGKQAEPVDDEIVEVTQVPESQVVESQDPLSVMEPPAKATRGKGRQASRQVSRQKGKAAPKKAPEPEPEPEADSSSLAMDSTAMAAEISHDTDASQSTVRRGRVASKTTASSKGTKKGGKPKNAAPATDDLQTQEEPATEIATEQEIEESFSSSKASASKPTKPKGKKAVSTGKKVLAAKQLAEQAEDAAIEAPVRMSPEIEIFESEKADGSSTSERPNLESQENDTSESSKVLDVEVAATTSSKPFSSHQPMPSPTPSPQSSDAENQPPSSRPSATRPPLAHISPSKSNTHRVQINASTPPSKRAGSKLETTFDWTMVDFEQILAGTPRTSKEGLLNALKVPLTEDEKKMTVEEWIVHQAQKGEEKLRQECERIVGMFESEGVRAIKSLEGIIAEE